MSRLEATWLLVVGFSAWETQQVTGLLMVLSPASHSRLVCMVSATLFYQGSPTTLFSWLTDAYSASIFLQGSSTMV